MVTHIDDEGFLWFGGVGGWDPVNLVGQRVELHTRDGDVVTGVVGKKPIHLLESEEREKAPKLKDLHIDIGAKDGDEARGRVRVGDWGGHRRRAGRARGRPLRVALDGQPPRLLGRARGRAARRRGRRRARRRRRRARSRRRRRRSAARPRRRSRSSPTSRSSSTSPTRPTRRASTSARRATTASAPAPVINAGVGRCTRSSSDLLRETAEAEGIPFAEEAADARHVHRRRRDPPQPQRRAVRDRLDPAALHALAGRGHAALRRRGVREAHRRVRADG